jgi:hypothetical protein
MTSIPAAEAPARTSWPVPFLRAGDWKAPSLRLIGLGDSLFEVFPFETRRSGEARTCPPRTVGLANILLGGFARRLNVGPREAVEVALRHNTEPCPAEAAKEKVVFCSRRGETLVFQADRQSQSAALCACGNATGAAAAMLARRLGRNQVLQSLQVPDGRLEAAADVERVARDCWRVSQAWLGIRCLSQDTTMHGLRVAVCRGSFNDYLIVRLASADDLEKFDVPQALALWSEARKLASAGFDNLLQARLVALAPRPGDKPFAKFYTCGRSHPGAPLTGLATLAMASAQVSWLADLVKSGTIEHRRGTDSLPSIKTAPQGFEVGFPTIDVVLKGV